MTDIFIIDFIEGKIEAKGKHKGRQERFDLFGKLANKLIGLINPKRLQVRAEGDVCKIPHQEDLFHQDQNAVRMLLPLHLKGVRFP
ncbi:hypothetical protein SDC9_212472 [bioreactor metagenome]|uniref:Uncharacterized protein n=1 Tax=bioreactor metagenome TaxID=1076179 RepID=A0A645JMT5_9ZZZZ